MYTDEMKKKLDRLEKANNASVLFKHKEFVLFKEVTKNEFNNNAWVYNIVQPIMAILSDRDVMIMELLVSSIFNDTLSISNLNGESSVYLENNIQKARENLTKELDKFYESLEKEKLNHSLAIESLDDYMSIYRRELDKSQKTEIKKSIAFLEEN